ncbi:DUF6526 family protein [Mucilaginibacter paludis]|uniref:Uncharacterized protein n=1 Tax=Mucilaginibacter paludis DSM 18603 TaxID=714943 RepID=H1YB45_9SPHI|nr:DUF6526 family protein [Mucilaginibacter paludis]EHQ30571.1 hypothetical protein Mucpa_6518 [Mucilaginibacter paludis DSM 18603]
MKPQNYNNHARYVTGYHFVLSLLLTVGLIVSLLNLHWHINDSLMGVSVLICVLFICGVFTFWFMRQFAIKAQDRAIRAEEGLRYLILSGKAFDSLLTMSQIVALRFAPDDELLELTARAVKENLSSAEIKKAIQNWKADHHRA